MSIVTTEADLYALREYLDRYHFKNSDFTSVQPDGWISTKDTIDGVRKFASGKSYFFSPVYKDDTGRHDFTLVRQRFLKMYNVLNFRYQDLDISMHILTLKDDEDDRAVVENLARLLMNRPYGDMISNLESFVEHYDLA